MSFATPLALAALALLPVLLAARWAARHRARRFAVRFTALPALAAAAAGERDWRRHVPLALLLAGVASSAVALAKPRYTGHAPVPASAIVLVTDHSGSMQAEDVAPTRLGAVEAAVDSFITELPSGVNLGLVGYSTQPDLVQPTSADHRTVRQLSDNQSPGGATATGDALQVALDLLRQGQAPQHSAVVLLSDGSTNVGRDPIMVAREAADLRIPIYTVALGTNAASVPNPDPTGPPLVAAPPDPVQMRQIARASGAVAFSARDAETLSRIYRRLGSQYASKPEVHQLAPAFAIGALVLLVAAAGTAQRWSVRLP